MEICHCCGLAIPTRQEEWHEVQTEARSWSGPAVWEDVPFHPSCWARAQYDDSHERAWARYLGANPDARDCS